MREKARGGRPALGSAKKTQNVYVGFTETEYGELLAKAQASGLNVQDFIRAAVAKGYVKNIDSPEQLEIKRGLIGLSNGVNQLLRQAHLQGLNTLHRKADELMDQLDELLTHYRR